jgi:hypothetical protein
MFGLLLNLFLLGLAILGILTILAGYKEPFLSPGIYPESDMRGILNQYQMRSNPKLSDETYESESRLYPIYSVGSYKQITNNKRYWEQPCNGTMAPANFCNSLYDKKNIEDTQTICRPGLDCNAGNRVNFYCANSA